MLKKKRITITKSAILIALINNTIHQNTVSFYLCRQMPLVQWKTNTTAQSHDYINAAGGCSTPSFRTFQVFKLEERTKPNRLPRNESSPNYFLGFFYLIPPQNPNPSPSLRPSSSNLTRTSSVKSPSNGERSTASDRHQRSRLQDPALPPRRNPRPEPALRRRISHVSERLRGRRHRAIHLQPLRLPPLPQFPAVRSFGAEGTVQDFAGRE